MKNMTQVAYCVAEAALWRKIVSGPISDRIFQTLKRPGWKQHSHISLQETISERPGPVQPGRVLALRSGTAQSRGRNPG